MNIPKIRGFCDLNIPYTTMDDRLLQRITEFDYRAIALNHTINVTKLNEANRKKKGSTNTDSDLDIFPQKLFTIYKNLLSKDLPKLKIFLRLTIVFSTPEQLKLIFSSQQWKRYDLIAALPSNAEAYRLACSHVSIDLISFEPGLTDYRPARKLHKQLVDRNGYFEICYAQTLRSNAKRQDTFTVAQLFRIYGKSKNAIISSGAQNYLELRPPLDVANLGLLFGFSEEQAKRSLSTNCKLLLLTAIGRLYGKAAIIVSVEKDDEAPNIKRIKLTFSDDKDDVTTNL